MGLLRMMFNSIMKRFLCRIGWHEWLWSKEDYPEHTLMLTPPDDCKCTHCGVPYGDYEEEEEEEEVNYTLGKGMIWFCKPEDRDENSIDIMSLDDYIAQQVEIFGKEEE